ncbi:MAG TPA: hypothetical protein VE010_08960 [Thermoanaerobaculia bacterium]|nr:hypothetical protein [Thermoanaerobaculia bacterium]
MKAVKLIAALAILTVAALAIRRYCYVPVRCSVIAAEIDRRTERLLKGPSYALEAGARANLARLQPCIDAVPWNVVYRDLAAANHKIREDHANVRAEYEAALRYDRRPELHVRLGLALLALGETEAAEKQLYTGGVVWPDSLLRLPQPLQDELLNRVYVARQGY